MKNYITYDEKLKYTYTSCSIAFLIGITPVKLLCVKYNTATVENMSNENG